MNAMQLLSLLGALVLLGADVPKAGAQEQQTEESGKLRVVKFPYDSEAARQDVVVFKYPEATRTGAERNYVKRLVGLPGETIVIRDGVRVTSPDLVIERITIEGGKVEISGGTIRIEGGKVEITRRPRP